MPRRTRLPRPAISCRGWRTPYWGSPESRSSGQWSSPRLPDSLTGSPMWSSRSLLWSPAAAFRKFYQSRPRGTPSRRFQAPIRRRWLCRWNNQAVLASSACKSPARRAGSDRPVALLKVLHLDRRGRALNRTVCWPCVQKNFQCKLSSRRTENLRRYCLQWHLLSRHLCPLQTDSSLRSGRQQHLDPECTLDSPRLNSSQPVWMPTILTKSVTFSRVTLIFLFLSFYY